MTVNRAFVMVSILLSTIFMLYFAYKQDDQQVDQKDIIILLPSREKTATTDDKLNLTFESSTSQRFASPDAWRIYVQNKTQRVKIKRRSKKLPVQIPKLEFRLDAHVALVINDSSHKQLQNHEQWSLLPLHTMTTIPRIENYKLYAPKKYQFAKFNVEDLNTLNQQNYDNYDATNYFVKMPVSSWIHWDTLSFLSNQTEHNRFEWSSSNNDIIITKTRKGRVNENNVMIDKKYDELNTQPYWQVPTNKDSWCQPLFTFGNMTARDINILVEYDRHRGFQKEQNPLLYRDLFNDFLYPFIEHQIHPWDNDAVDEIYITNNKDICSLLCEDRKSCLSWRFNSLTKHCGISESIRIGHKPMKYNNHNGDK